MAERFSDHSGGLTKDERDRLEILAENIEDRQGPLAVEGINKQGEVTAHLTYDESASHLIQQAEDTVRIARHAPRLFRRRYAATQDSTDSATEHPTSSWPRKRILQVGGVALVSGGLVGSVIASLTLVFLGASLNVALPIIGGAFLFGALIGASEARKETRPPRS